MRIASLSVKNLRRIPDFDLEVGPKLILAGPNDSGKSSIVRALHLTLAPVSLADVFSARDFTEPGIPITVDVILGELTPDERVAFTDEVVHGVGEPALPVRLEATVDPVDGAVTAQRTFPGFDNKRVPNTQAVQFGWAYVSANRVLAREVGVQRGGALFNLLSSIDISNPNELNEAITRFREALNAIPALAVLRERVADALTTALPRPISATDLILLAGAELEANPLRDVALALSEDGAVAGLDEQSDGMRALTALALHSLANEQAQIIGIDEPELHLHPPAQRSVGKLLANDPAQHVVATNSANVLAQFDPSHVAALSPSRHIRILPPGAKATDRAFVARWWAQPIIEPLTAARLLVVEGVFDRLVVRSASEALGRDLDKKGVAILDLDGANTITSLVRLYGKDGFDVPLYGLVDADQQEAWADALGVAPADLGTVHVQTCAPDLEGQLVASLGPDRVVQLLTAGGISELEIRLGCSVPTGAIPAPTLLAWMQKRANKKDSAVAIATSLTVDDAKAIEPIRRLIEVRGPR